MERVYSSPEGLTDENLWINSDLYRFQNTDGEEFYLNTNVFDDKKPPTKVKLAHIKKSERLPNASDTKTKHYDTPTDWDQNNKGHIPSGFRNNEIEEIINPTERGTRKQPFAYKRRAFSLAGEFELMTSHLYSTGEDSSSMQYLEAKPETNLQVNLYVETKDLHLGPYLFEVYPKMSVGLLKLKVEKELLIPAFSQRWILNNQLAINDDSSLLDYGTIPGSSLFLYVDSSHDSKFDVKQLSGAHARRHSTEGRIKSFEPDAFCHGFNKHFVKSSNQSSNEELFTNADNSFPDTSLEIDNQTLHEGSKKENNVPEETCHSKNTENKSIKKNKFKTSFGRKNLRLKKDAKLANVDPSYNSCSSNPSSSTASDCNILVDKEAKNMQLKFENSCSFFSRALSLEDVKNCLNLQHPRLSLDGSFKIDSNISEHKTLLQKPRKSIIQNLRSKHRHFNPGSKSFEANDLPLKKDVNCEPELGELIDKTENLPNLLIDMGKVNRIHIDDVSEKCHSTETIQEVMADHVKNSTEVSDDHAVDDNNTEYKLTETLQDVIENQNATEICKALENEPSPNASKMLPLAEICIVKPQYPHAANNDDGSTKVIENLQEERLQNELNQESAENYEFLLRLENSNLVRNVINFTCPICFGEFESDQGVVLHECLHSFCLECLGRTVEYAEETLIKCPYRDDEYSCQSFLQQREIKALVSAEVYERYLQKSITTAESLADKSFHCKTPDCHGWCLFENNINIFHCPVCFRYNCLNCGAQHEGLNCRQYQEKLKSLVKSDPDSEKTLEFLNKMIDSGKAMKCPKCDLILMKKWGCDWLKCSVCLTEICWITKGPRWGPAGQGDTSAGCRCGVNGVKCHPSCTYCH